MEPTPCALTSPELMVCQTLRAATVPQYEIVREAEAKLAEWDTQPGFFLTLAKLCVVCKADRQLAVPQDEMVRWMAAVYLKNGVNKYWRRCTRSEISSEEKKQIREMLLQNFETEPVPQVAVQIAVLIARIARFDCPREWPELMPHLMKRLQETSSNESVNSLALHRVLLVLHHVVKALASRRIMPEKRIFEELTGNIFTYIVDVWKTFTTAFFHRLETTPDTAMLTLEQALLAMKILRKLIMFGFSKPAKSDDCLQCLEQLFLCLKQCLECRYELKRLNTQDNLKALLEKFILKQLKTLLEFADHHSLAFVRLVPMALEFSFNHVFHEGTRLIFTNNAIDFPNFVIHCINMMKSIMLCETYPTDNDTEDANAITLSNFFTNERLSYMSEKIIMHYFLLTPSELNLWREDPETFAQDDGGESWKYELRSCVETFYVTCFTQYQALMTAEVGKYIRKAQQTQLTIESDIQDILLKDAIYNAAGRASFHFFNEIDFDEWFSTQLISELSFESDNFRILRRRIIWLVAEWAGVRFSRSLRPLAYGACLHLLRPNEDMATRLSAARTISTLIGDFEFSSEGFLPYLEPIFNGLFVLLHDARECDTKMKVLTVMSLIVENASEHIEPLADNLIGYLPLLWKESETYNMLRCAIICTLQELIKAIRDIPDKMKPFLYSVIELSTNLKEPSHIYLMEEGLSLWKAVIENTSALNMQLENVCENLLPIIEQSTENMRTVLMIIQAYVVLDAHAFFRRFGRDFVDFCLRSLSNLRPEAIVLILRVFETFLRADSTYGLQLLRPTLPHIFNQVYQNEDFPMLMSMYLTMIARILLINQAMFTQILQELQFPDALEKILDVWIEKMPLVIELEKRKLFCLAFASIFTNNPIILERFNFIMQNIGRTLGEVMQEEDESTDAETEFDDSSLESKAIKHTSDKPVKFFDSLVFVDDPEIQDSFNCCTIDDISYKTHHFDRCRELAIRDPVHKIVLAQYVEWQMGSLRTQMTDQAYQQLMKSICPETLFQISKYIKLELNFVLVENADD